MANLNGTEDIRKFIDDEPVQLGQDLEKDAQVPFEIAFKGQDSDIFFVFGGCHCTDAFYEDGKIKGTINIARSQYDRETGVLTQYVMVYMNDGRDFYLQDSKKRRVSNPDKDWFRITLAGKVKI